MNKVQIILPVSKWVDKVRCKLGSLMTEYQITEDEIDLKDTEAIKSVIVCICWNYFIYDLKHKQKLESWDTKHYLNKLVTEDEIIELEYDKDLVNRLTSYVEELIYKDVLKEPLGNTGWELVAMYSTAKDVVLNIGGDYRAKEWCREHNQEYDW